WNSIMDNLGTAHVQIYRNGTKDNVNNRTTEILSTFKRAIEKERLARLNVDPVKLVPIQEEVIEISEQKELLGKRLGGFIPYLFILSMWGGCLLAGIDLVTGEKERKTIETTLSLPVSSFSILMGKTVVASLLGFIPALLNLIGLIIGLKFIEGIPAFIQSAINEMLSFQSVSLILLLLIPFALFLSSIIIALITGAKTFKEAQSKATPIIMAIILPLVLAMMPGIELNWTTAFIPVLNIGLAIKEVMAGTINMAYYSVILVSLIAFAIGAIYLSYRKFNDERAILG
ncbi:MAG: ABC transporter permease, partial [Flavobacteriaceae bacterium]